MYKPKFGLNVGNFRENKADETIDKVNQNKLEVKKKRKESQKELTQALLNAYSAIKPTIIQAQRILKIIDSLVEQISIAKYLNYKFIKHFQDQISQQKSGQDLSLVEQLPEKSTQTTMRKLSDLQIKVVDLKGGEDYQPEEDEDDTESKEETESDDDKDNSDDEEKKRLEDQNAATIAEWQVEIGKIFRSLIRDLLFRKKDLEIIKKLNENYNDGEMFNDVYDCLTSLRAIYQKKQSTAHDEEVNHSRQQEELKKKIDEHKKIKKQKEDELTKQKIDRGRNNNEKNDEINKLKNELQEVKTKEEAKTQEMKNTSEGKLLENAKNHAEREGKLKDALTKARKELEEKRKQNSETENLLKKKKQNAENKYETAIKEYDREMENLSAEIQRETDFYNGEKKKLDDLEEEYRKIQHAKQVNKKLEDDWAIKLQQFEIEENRKVDAAKYIAEMWAAWKERKKKKKGRRGGMKAK